MGNIIKLKCKLIEPTYWSPKHPAEYLNPCKERPGHMVGKAFLHQHGEDLGRWNVQYLFDLTLETCP